MIFWLLIKGAAIISSVLHLQYCISALGIVGNDLGAVRILSLLQEVTRITLTAVGMQTV